LSIKLDSDHLISEIIQILMYTETNNQDFLSLIQDETFIRLVNDAEGSEELLAELLSNNPPNRESIKYAIEFIRFNKANKTTMDAKDYNRILLDLQKQYKKKSSSSIFRAIPFYLRIAAILLIFFSIGSLVVYQKFVNDPLTQFAQRNVVDGNHAMIVLSDGSYQTLKNNDSYIDYKSTNGEVIIKNRDQKDIIDNSSNQKDAVLNQVVVPFGQRQRVLLSDGTFVLLNAGSKLTFPASFNGKYREVFLKGEAFFEVSKNANKPFIVKTDQIDIRVLGTTFNVTAYENEQFVTTVLLEGKVNVEQKDKLFANKKFILSPGQACFYSVVDKYANIKEVNVDDYVLWKDGLYKFNDMPLRDVVYRVRRYYNLDVQIRDEHLANTLVSGKLVLTDDIAEVVKYLSKTMEGRYEKISESSYILVQ
jgi:transmembrane sensor